MPAERKGRKMKLIVGTTLAVVVIAALVAGKDDIRKLFWMRNM